MMPHPLLSSSITRRWAVTGLAALAFAPAFGRPAGSTLIAGTYTMDGGKGLYRLTLEGAAWKAGPLIQPLPNSSFGTRSPRTGHLYFVSEVRNGLLAIYDRDGRELATRSTGSGPCHVALGPDEATLVTANYGGGNITLFRLDEAGLPIGEPQTAQHEGSGPNAARQPHAEAHWAGFSTDRRWLYVPDLGADAVYVHGFDAAARTLGDMRIAYRAPSGSGPRHMARHPRLPLYYLVSELASTLTLLAPQDDGTFRPLDIRSTLPPGFSGTSTLAHIVMNAAATRLYVSNRGHNSIAVFALARDGSARLIQNADTGGDWPRCFVLMEDRRELLVGNQHTGSIARMTVDRDGLLHLTADRFPVPGVAFLIRT
jgi:6-phosphogluconolactonase